MILEPDRDTDLGKGARVTVGGVERSDEEARQIGGAQD